MSSAVENQQLSWAEKPLPELVRLAWPITVSMLSYSVMTLADTLIVGRLGSAPLAGIGLGGIAAFAIICFSMGLLRSTKVLVSQAHGAGHAAEARLFAAAGIWLALGLGVVTLAVGVLVAPWVAQIAASAEAGRAAADYLSVRMFGAPMVLLGVVLREASYGAGNSRVPMRAAVIANLLNIGLAYTAVHVLGLGVAGAAAATCVAQTVETAIIALAQVRLGLPLRSVRPAQLRALWRLGLPLGVQFILEVGAFALLTALIAHRSEVEMAAHQIAIQVIHFSFLPAFAVGEAVSVLVGQAIGARRDALVRPLFRLAMKVSAVYTGMCTVILFAAAGLLARGFTDDPALIEAARHLLLIAAVFQIFDGANIIARGVLRGAGDVRAAAVVGVCTSWIATPPLMWLLGYQLGWGAVGGWLGLCLEIIVGAAILWERVEKLRWVAAAESVRRERQETELELNGGTDVTPTHAANDSLAEGRAAPLPVLASADEVEVA